MARHRDHPLNDRLRVERDRLEAAYEQRLADMYAEVLRAIGSDAARRFQRASWGKPIIAAAGDWHPPHPDEVYPADASDRLNAAAGPLRGAMWQDVVDGINVALSLELTVTNPLLADSIGQLGRNITAVTDSQRSDIMRVVQEAHDQGLSIRNTAKAILEQTSIGSKVRAQAIARTELTAATNLGGLAAARLVSRGDMLKRWASASDAFVRPAHADANAAYADDPIPVEQPFTVGGELLMAPGDPSGSAGNVVNCRCTTIYLQREPTPQRTESEPEPEPVPEPDPEAGDDLSALRGIPTFRESGAKIGRIRQVASDVDRPPDTKGIIHRSTLTLRGGVKLPVWVEADPALSVYGDAAEAIARGNAENRLRRLARQLSALPPKMRREVGRVGLAMGESPSNEAIRSKLGLPEFKAAATASHDTREIIFWDGYSADENLLAHEAGHTVGGSGGAKLYGLNDRDPTLLPRFEQAVNYDSKKWDLWTTWSGGGPAGDELGTRWLEAAVNDLDHSRALNAKYGGIVSTAKRTVQVDKLGVTSYGGEAIYEDWAESVALYLESERIGHIASASYRKANGFMDIKWLTFADLYPERAKLLRRFLGRGVLKRAKRAAAAAVRPRNLLVRRVVLDDLDAVAFHDRDHVRAPVRARTVYTLRRRHTHTVPDEGANGK